MHFPYNLQQKSEGASQVQANFLLDKIDPSWWLHQTLAQTWVIDHPISGAKDHHYQTLAQTLKSNILHFQIWIPAYQARKEHGLLGLRSCRHHVVRKYVQVNRRISRDLLRRLENGEEYVFFCQVIKSKKTSQGGSMKNYILKGNWTLSVTWRFAWHEFCIGQKE